MHNSSLHRFTVLLAVCTLFLIAAGASVTSNQAGLSVPDWPLSYGQVMPKMEGGVFFEHGHRMIASTVGFLTIILVIWVWRKDDRPWMRWLSVAALCAVIAQGVLGGMTVLFLLPKPVSIAHACLAQIFFSLTIAMAIFTSKGWRYPADTLEDHGWPSLRILAGALPVLMLAQIALGAAFRHRAIGIVPHIVGAFVVTAFAFLAAMFVLTQAGSHKNLKFSSLALLAITSVQVMLGLSAYALRVADPDTLSPGMLLIVFTILHVAAGALTFGASVAMSLQVARHVRPKFSAALPAVS